MLSQHEADTLAEAVVVLGNLYDAAKGEAMGGGVKLDEAFWLGMFRGRCDTAKAAIGEVLTDAVAYLDDERARDVLGAG